MAFITDVFSRRIVGWKASMSMRTPERLSLRTLAALCDILDCGPGDLIEPFLAERKTRKTAAAADPDKVVELHDSDRPRRARIIDDR